MVESSSDDSSSDDSSSDDSSSDDSSSDDSSSDYSSSDDSQEEVDVSNGSLSVTITEGMDSSDDLMDLFDDSSTSSDNSQEDDDVDLDVGLYLFVESEMSDDEPVARSGWMMVSKANRAVTGQNGLDSVQNSVVTGRNWTVTATNSSGKSSRKGEVPARNRPKSINTQPKVLDEPVSSRTRAATAKSQQLALSPAQCLRRKQAQK
ncbi:acidic repeat-containing protein-like isoform X2 [Nilaparvata lugens]|uniref:acidic repeat-containing protein-like isoform X2 n=1 Tax=Nilaparvata lugens TaxID=108931 RepID=UPI00193E14C0|nr:acidic repeat-containing protein-like isoform X2 [Nilaparvata lugens]XP_039299499.1 acidic repeat-containing protein-like isoform X2 [Nilaparvata lugens]